ncbi:FbpB family small basic protein [Bacillaceae bacterium Marseille-Q3522]|nr:FbpB family small basic protein [Bacillaceae bacterium Marseille-Q3522]
MRKIRKRTFLDLVSENKQQLLSDHEAMEKIELRIEKKRLSKAK